MIGTMPLRILLTGSSGFLGQHLLRCLTETCPPETIVEIHALYKSAENFPKAVQDRVGINQSVLRVHVVKLDLSEQDQVEQWIQGLQYPFDVCIHTAALSVPQLCEEKPEYANQINNPTHFFDALYRINPKMRMIALSTDQVYAGDKPPYKETHPVQPRNAYGRSKVNMEDSLLRYSGWQTFLLRSSIIVGSKAPILPDVAHDTFLHFIASRKGQDTVFFTDEKRSVVSIRDVVAVILALTFAEDIIPTGIYNMGGPESLSRMDMAHAMFSYLSYDCQHLIPAKKADQPSGPVPSPLDITMDSTKLYTNTGLSFQPLRSLIEQNYVDLVDMASTENKQ